MISKDLVSITLRKYQDGPTWGLRRLGRGRTTIDLGKWAIVLEFWWLEWRDRD